MRFRFIASAFIFLLLLSCGKSEDETLRVVTGNVTDITPFSAVIHAYGYPPESEGNVTFGFIYSMIDPPTVTYGGRSIGAITGTKKEMEAVNNEYSVKISDLHPGITYYYRAFTLWNWLMGDVKSFTTKPMKASLSLLPVIVENQNSVTLRAYLDTEYMDLLDCTFFIVFSEKEYIIAELEANRPDYRQLAPCDLSDGSISLLQTGFKPNHEYFFVAGAILYDRIFYSPIGSFTINPDVALTSHSPDR